MGREAGWGRSGQAPAVGVLRQNGGGSLVVGLAAYWKMDEASGNRADATGRGSTLTEVGGAIAGAAGKIANAAHIIRTDARHLTTASSANVSFGISPFSVVGWIKPASASTQFYIVKGSNASQIEYAIYQAGGGFSFTIYNGTASTALATASRTPAGMTGNYHFVAGRYDGNGSINITVDASIGANVALAGGTPGGNALDLAVGGRAGGGSNYADADMDEVGIWKRYLSDAELARLYNGGAGLAFPFSWLGNLVFEGDSITAGTVGGVAANANYPFQTLARLGAAKTNGYKWANVANNGATMTTMNAEAAATVDTLYTPACGQNIASLCGGTNDLRVDGKTPQQVHDLIAAWVSGRQAAGFKVIVHTITPSTYAGDPADIITQIANLNTFIRADRCGADGLCDVAADSRLSDSTNATYFVDGLHNTVAGYAARAELLTPVMMGL